MTMKKRRAVPAGKFKAECLALIDRVAETHETIVVTKHGRPMVQVMAFETFESAGLARSVRTRGDIVSPALGDWDVDR